MKVYIYQDEFGQDMLSPFFGRTNLDINELVFKTKNVSGRVYLYAEPATRGSWANGGTFIYSHDSNYFTHGEPIPLHDRNMNLEG